MVHKELEMWTKIRLQTGERDGAGGKMKNEETETETESVRERESVNPAFSQE